MSNAANSAFEDNTGCCCGPYPIIDLSEAFTSRYDGGIATTESLKRIRDELKKACNRYGCFHVSINSKNAPLSVLSNESEVKQRIESLFEEDFLNSIHDDSGCSSDSAPVVPSFRDKNDVNKTLNAVYRGRNAESGSSKNSSAEPKRSWELFRCSSSTSMQGTDTNTGMKNERLQILQSFVDILHEVAETLCSKYLLDLPEDRFICSSKSTDISLLRVFRYDALSTEKERSSNLGSSSHTDWGR